MRDKPLRVLVADGNVDSADTTALLIRMWGHDARVVYTGTDALAAVLAYRPDVVVSDIVLPQVDGLKLAAELRDSAVLIALTGLSTDSYRQRSAAVGFAHFLVKPVDPEQLQRILQRIAGPTSALAVLAHPETPVASAVQSD